MGERASSPSYSPREQAFLARIEADVTERLAQKKHRLAHSLSVAREAESLALLYGVEPYPARVAGTLHDWDKALSNDELLERARALDVDMGVDLELVLPLLHGIVAARELPERYPELTEEELHSIAVHTTAAPEMSPLDEIIFIADGIEPLRPATPGIERSRSLVGSASLDDLFWESFVGGIIYVLRGARYLWPGTIETYNALAAKRGGRS